MPTSTNAIYKAAAQFWKLWLHDDALLTLSQGTSVTTCQTNKFKTFLCILKLQLLLLCI